MSHISVVTICRNEEGVAKDIYAKTKNIFACLSAHSYEHIFIDSASTDRTTDILREIAAQDRCVKIIVSTRDFGFARASYYGLLQAEGHAAILIGAELLEQPSLISDFIHQWEAGYKVVVGRAKERRPGGLAAAKRLYYNIIERFSEIDVIRDFTGVGLYDRKVLDALKGIPAHYSPLGGLVGDLGFARACVEYTPPQKRTNTGLYAAYDLLMLEITSHSKLPLRLASMLGLVLSVFCLLAALVYLAGKVIFWDRFSMGIAPLAIGFFFFSAVQLFFIGMIGEYLGGVLIQVKGRPLVIEKERINF